MDDIRNHLESARDLSRDHSLKLLSDAVYRGDGDAKLLERQCAKISRAIDKAIHELDILTKISTNSTDECSKD